MPVQRPPWTACDDLFPHRPPRGIGWKTPMSEATFPIDLDGRTIECLTEPDRTMLQEAHGICCDRRSSERHSAGRLREISEACRQYDLGKMSSVIADLAAHSTH